MKFIYKTANPEHQQDCTTNAPRHVRRLPVATWYRYSITAGGNQYENRNYKPLYKTRRHKIRTERNSHSRERGNSNPTNEAVTNRQKHCGNLGWDMHFNIYAPLGAEKKFERETFYNTDLLSLLPATRSGLLLAGDFNCVMSQSDTTGQKNYSKTLEFLVRGLNLQGVWNETNMRHRFTHYVLKRAARLDRIYLSQHLIPQKQGVETIEAVFTDHHAVVLGMATEDPFLTHGRGCWRKNSMLLRDPAFQQVIQTQWKNWTTHQQYYPDSVAWLERYVNQILKRSFTREGTERRCERRTLENFYYASIYDILDAPMDPGRQAITLKRLMHKSPGYTIRRDRKSSLTPKIEMWLKKNHPSIITSVPDHDRTTEQSHTYKTVMKTLTRRCWTFCELSPHTCGRNVHTFLLIVRASASWRDTWRTNYLMRQTTP